MAEWENAPLVDEPASSWKDAPLASPGETLGFYESNIFDLESKRLAESKVWPDIGPPDVPEAEHQSVLASARKIAAGSAEPDDYLSVAKYRQRPALRHLAMKEYAKRDLKKAGPAGFAQDALGLNESNATVMGKVLDPLNIAPNARAVGAQVGLGFEGVLSRTLGLWKWADDASRWTSAYEEAAQELQAERAPGAGTVARYGRALATSLLPQAAIGKATHSPVASIGYGTALTGNQAMTEARDLGKSNLEALAYAGKQGAYEAIPELLFNRLGKFIPGAGGTESALAAEGLETVGKEIRKGITGTISEGLTEGITGAAQELEQAKLYEREAALGQPVGESALLGALGGGLVSAPSIAASAVYGATPEPPHTERRVPLPPPKGAESDTMSQFPTGDLPRVDTRTTLPPIQIDESGAVTAPTSILGHQDASGPPDLTQMSDRDLGARLAALEAELEALDDLADPKYDSLSIEEQLVKAEIAKRSGRTVFHQMGGQYGQPDEAEAGEGGEVGEAVAGVAAEPVEPGPAVGVPGTVVEGGGGRSAESSRTRDALDELLRRAKMEDRGQELSDDLDELDEIGVTPKQVVDEFFDKTYDSLPPEIQKKIQVPLKNMIGMVPGDVLAVHRDGRKVVAKDWKDIGKFAFEDYGSFQQIGAEGWDKPYKMLIGLMGYLNQQRTGGQAIKAETPKIPAPAAVEDRPAGDVAEPELITTGPKRGKVGGMMLATGEVVLTASGRQTTPFPKIDTSTNQKATNTVRRVERWLLENAIAEAESRGDEYNARMFRSETGKNIPQASRDAMDEYLFGEQPPVLPPITKPLQSKTAVSEKTTKQEGIANAREVRSDEAPVQETGVVERAGQDEGGADLQRPAEVGGGAGNAEAQGVVSAPQTRGIYNTPQSQPQKPAENKAEPASGGIYTPGVERPAKVGKSGQTAIPGLEQEARIGEARDEEDARWKPYIDRLRLEVGDQTAEAVQVHVRGLTDKVRKLLEADTDLSTEQAAGELAEGVTLPRTGSSKTDSQRRDRIASVLEEAVAEAFAEIAPTMKEAGGWKVGQPVETRYPQKFGKIARFDVDGGVLVAVVQPNDEAKERNYDLTDLMEYEPEPVEPEPAVTLADAREEYNRTAAKIDEELESLKKSLGAEKGKLQRSAKKDRHKLIAELEKRWQDAKEAASQRKQEALALLREVAKDSPEAAETAARARQMQEQSARLEATTAEQQDSDDWQRVVQAGGYSKAKSDTEARIRDLKGRLARTKDQNKWKLESNLQTAERDLARIEALNAKFGKPAPDTASQPPVEAPKVEEPVAEPEKSKFTGPTLEQYDDIKSKMGDVIVLFRMGDFYEAFKDDAKKVSKGLGLTLTTRDKGDTSVPMAGFPYHQLESYLGKLIAGGHRVAVAEQVDPRNKPLEREVERVVGNDRLVEEPKEVEPTTEQLPAAEFKRRTPPLGTPERESLESAWKAYTERDSKLSDEIDAIEKEYDKTRYGTKKREKLKAKKDAIQEQRYALDEENEGLSQKVRLAFAEDMVEQATDEANRIAAIGNVNDRLRESGSEDRVPGGEKAYERVKALVRAEAEKQGATKEEADILESDLSGFILSFPSKKKEDSVAFRVMRRLETYRLEQTSRDAEKALDSLEDIEHSYKKRVRNQIELSKQNPDRVRELLAEAKEANESQRKRREEIKRIEQAVEESARKKRSVEAIPLSEVPARIDEAFDGGVFAAESGYFSDGRSVVRLDAIKKVASSQLSRRPAGSRSFDKDKSAKLAKDYLESESLGKLDFVGVTGSEAVNRHHAHFIAPDGTHYSTNAQTLAWLEKNGIQNWEADLGKQGKTEFVRLSVAGKPVAVATIFPEAPAIDVETVRKKSLVQSAEPSPKRKRQPKSGEPSQAYAPEPSRNVGGFTASTVPLNTAAESQADRLVSARDIVATLAKEFGTTLQYGRVPNKTAGNYAVWSEVARVSNSEMASLATETHEIAHDVDKKTEVLSEAVGGRKRPHWTRLIRRAERQFNRVKTPGKGQKWLDKWAERLTEAGAPQTVADAVNAADFGGAVDAINQVLGTVTQEQLDIAAELEKLDYAPLDRVEEGFAEWARTFLTRDDAASKAPRFTSWMLREWLPKHPKFRKAFLHGKELIDAYRAQTPLERAEQNRAMPGDQPKALDVPVAEGVKEWAGTALDKLAADWTDPYHFLELLEKDWEKQGGVPGPLDNTTVEVARYADGTTMNHVNRAVFGDGIRTVAKGKAKVLSKSLKDVFAKLREGGYDPEEWDSWHVARHIILDVVPNLEKVNLRRTLEGKEPIHYNPGMRLEDAEAIYKQVKADSAKHKVFEQTSKEFSSFGDSILDMLADSGVITNALAGKLKDYYKNHASLRKVRPGSVLDRLIGRSQGALNVRDPIRRRSLKGRGLPLMAQVDAMYLRLAEAYHAALVHTVKLAILNKVVKTADGFFQGQEGMGEWARIEEPNLKKLEIEVDEVLSQLVKKGFIEEEDAKKIRAVNRLRNGSASAKDLEFLESQYGIQDEDALIELTDSVPSLEETLITFRPDYKPSESEFIEVMNVRGRPTLVRWNPGVYDILRRMGPLQLSAFERMLAGVADVMRLGTTGLNLRFGFKQLFSDFFTYQFQAKEASVAGALGRPLEALGRVAGAIWNDLAGQKKAPLMELMEGTYGSLFEEMQPDAAGAQYMRTALFVDGTLPKLKSVLGQPQLYVRSLHNAVRQAGNILAYLDLPSRLAEGSALLKKHGYVEKKDPTGKWRWFNEEKDAFEDPPIELERKFLAAVADATVPFRRIGHRTRYYNRVWFPYFGPWVAGQMQMVGRLKSAALGNERARAALLAGTLSTVGLSFLMAYLTAGDDDKEEESPWTRSGYWQFHKQFAPRKPQSWSWVPNLAEAILALLYSKDGLNKAREYAVEELRNQSYFELPGLDSDPVLGNVAKMTGVGPLAEVVANRKTFEDRPIEPDYMEGLPAGERYDTRTTTVGKVVGQATGPALDIGPKKVDYLMQKGTGGLLTRNPLENPLRGYEPQASVREFDERFTEVESERKASRLHGKPWTDEQEAEYDRLYGAKRMMVEMFKLSRSGQLAEDQESKYRVGVARSALGREPLESYPDLYLDYAELPPELKGLVDDRLASLARKVLANKPVSVTDKEKEGGLTLEAKRTAWQKERAAAIKELKENAVGQDVATDAVRAWIRGDLKDHQAERDKMRRFRQIMGW